MAKIVIIQPWLSPEITIEIESRVSAQGYICSAYKTEDLDAYNIDNLLFERHANKHRFHAILDRNIVSSLVSAARRGCIKYEDEQLAIELLCFLRASEVNIEPGIAIAEYSDTYFNADADAELNLLRRIDNISRDNLIELATGVTRNIDLESSTYNEHTTRKDPINKAEEIHQWRMTYGHVLKLFLLYHRGLAGINLLKEFMH